MGINEFIVGHPERVGNALHTFEVVYISGCDDELDVDGLGHPAHCLGYRLLVIPAVAAEVIGKVEVEGLFKALPFLSMVCRHRRLSA